MSIELCERSADGNAKGKSQPPRTTGPGVSNNRYYACAYVDSGNTACNRPPVYTASRARLPISSRPVIIGCCAKVHTTERVKENECRLYCRLLLLSQGKITRTCGWYRWLVCNKRHSSKLNISKINLHITRIKFLKYYSFNKIKSNFL